MPAELKKRFYRWRRTRYKPLFKMALSRLVVFYQRHLSRGTCLYEPTCSEYMKRCLNNKGVILGLFIGLWRILRCNPLSKGGYDPAPEKFFRYRWVI